MRYLLVSAVLGLVLFGSATLGHKAGLFAAEDSPATEAEQTTPASPEVTDPATPPAPSPSSQIVGTPRVLAPGVMITIPPDVQVDETHQRQDIIELVTLDPTFDWAKDRDFRRTVHCLEFSFKLPRLIEVDMPQTSGRLQRKPVLYLVYRVTNTGKALKPVPEDDGTYRVEEVAETVPFLPRFTLKIWDSGKEYPDRPNPRIAEAIRRREDPAILFFDSTAMNERQLDYCDSFWGVATWEDVDPSLNRFSVFVSGLSNAYRWEDPPGAYKPGDPIGQGRVFLRKQLQLNFWRPGDEFILKESQIRFGIPGQVDYAWVFR
ncbi:MAG: hypothetical protein ACUVQK_03075 [Thermogutta sp.]